MPIAAVPRYLGQEFNDASPGLRFGMYLKLWGVNRRTRSLLWGTHDLDYEVRGEDQVAREVKYENQVSALADSTRLMARDQATLRALALRQNQCAQTVPLARRLRLDALSIAPLTTGLGNEHPLENGFAFLNPYGLPYMPGSGVKGVLRQAARELASGEWGQTHGWSDAKTYPLLRGEGERRKPVLNERTHEPVRLSLLDVLFGRETDNGDTAHVRGALTFWDVIPQIPGDSLMVEIMTPHQSPYYQAPAAPDGNNPRAYEKWIRKTAGSLSPHDSGQPNPISFLTVPPRSKWTFHVMCDVALLARLAPDLLEVEDDQPRWQTLVTAAFEHAFQWLGFGAKTSVGYGAMARDMAAEQKARQQLQKQLEAQAQAARREQMSDAMREIDAFNTYMQQRHEALQRKRVRPNGQEHELARKLAKAALQAKDQGLWTPEELSAAVSAIEQWLPKVVDIDMKAERKKLGLAQITAQN